MVRARDRGTEQVWRPREDLLANLQRRLDFGAAIRLKGIDEVVVRGVDVEGGTLVRICARFSRGVDRVPAVAATTTTAVTALGGAALSTLPEFSVLLELTVVGVGSVAAGIAAWRAGRHAVEQRRRQVTEAVEGLLDELELGRHPGGRNAFDRLAARARRVRGGYRL
jgi:hypothetical protein